MTQRKVYILADYLVSAFGTGTEPALRALREGRSGLEMYDDGLRQAMCALVPREDYASMMEEYGEFWTSAELYAVAALGNILPAGDPSCRRALVLATTKGNVGLLESAPEGEVPVNAFLSVTAQKVGFNFGFTEKDIYVVSNACISGVSAIIVGKRLIEYGLYDEVAVVGVDVLNDFIISGFDSFHSLSPQMCRPYDEARCGLNLGEGAGAVLLSSRPAPYRSASGEEVAVEVSGGAISDDANHISGPSRTGDGLYFAMRDAMQEAGVSAGDISFVNLHGTATVYNDEMESKAMALAGLSDVPAQSLKPYFGHTLGASGLMDSIMGMHQLLEGKVFATPGFEKPGTPFPVNASSSAREIPMRHCLKTASGFGGCNAAILLSLVPFGQTVSAAPKTLPGIKVLRRVEISPATAQAEGQPTDFHTYIRTKFKSLGVSDMKFYKMDNLSKLGYVASSILLDGLEYDPEDVSVILQNRSASLDSDLKHQDNISFGPGASPAVFVYTLPNVASGEISIRHKIKGENTFFIADEYTEGRMKDYAAMVLGSTKARYCIVGWLDYLQESYMANLELIELQ